MKAGIFTLILLLFFCERTFSQMSSSPREMFLEAETYFLYEEYKEALPLYIQLSLTYPENDNINYRIGRCYLNIPYEKEKSISYLETASKNINSQYKGESLKEIAAPPDVIYYLADAYRINNQLDKALGLYRQFKSFSDSSVFNFSMVDDQIRACENAKIMESQPVKVACTNLGETVNSRFSETNAVVSGNERVLVYSAQLQFYTAVFYATWQNDKWSKPFNINANLGVDDDCLPVGISYDGKELLLYRNNEYLGDLYVSRFVNGKWSKVKRLNNNINTKYWESHACLSRDGKRLYFTSNRKESTGGLDIFVSTRQDIKTDNWETPQKLEPGINTVYDEETPFITADDGKLYFSSTGHNTMGGFDVFVSENKFGKWLEPQNLGYPLNTPDNDLFYHPVGNGEVGYMTLSRKDTHGKNDIYKIEITNTLSDNSNNTSYLIATEALKEEDAEISTPGTPAPVAVVPLISTSYIQADKQNNQTKTDHKLIVSTAQAPLISSDKLDQPASSKPDNNDSSYQPSSLDSDTNANLTPGQKQAWHKLLYGGLGLLGVFTFFILFLFLRSRKQKK